jgi:sugar O-acyltransferase (sialic acid O-acetyltransferase NeuD family)
MKIALVGYSGHALVCADVLENMGHEIVGYFEQSEKNHNPLNIPYLGLENDLSELKNKFDVFFNAVGDNNLRKHSFNTLLSKGYKSLNAIHNSAILSNRIKLETGILVAPGAIINAYAEIDTGTIINSGAIVEHECVLGKFVHIAPNTTLCGNVKVGNGSFIGAGAVVKQGVTIGENCIIGAGSVVLNNINDHSIIIGNPAKELPTN